ncbi:cytoplasmic protein [Aspergillus brunneoviolaceus CBS 621.78]|uniref:Cytoplasmic protein n=1 Tax=Aspergillus brunneoviolaceus CBS 621.78 TaxID=1450534 RepID=A0ACD1GHN6_9EURO|nr:cytoplasmic protein [Aspergillus brunneoviolaceus CBS 621.78]RAH48762.1 cytoplasmic protein [Aspergillus brunneoviolaceus CBS 621.78]
MMERINPNETPYFDLGSHARKVTTTSKEAQTWFNRGLVWAYSFNVGEAGKCFEQAAQHDPKCAMAYWGIAYATGPNYNKAYRFFDKEDLYASIEKANRALTRAWELLLEATPRARFPPSDQIPDDFSSQDRAYADAMRPVYQRFGTDADIAALFADALMCMTPRGLWDLDTGKPTGEHTVEARRVIEEGMQSAEGRHHPALCHLHIHVMEMSPYPELALPAADRLRSLVPDASHMLHMPTHIDAAVGDYCRAVDSNHLATLADDKYFSPQSLSLLPGGSLTYIAYRVHYICAKLYAAMMSGRFADAMSAAEKLEAVLDDQLLSIESPPVADSVESFVASKAHVLIRFGRWEEILTLPLPANRELYCASTAVILYARGLAFSALSRIHEGELAQREFEAARAKVPESRLNSIPCKQVDVLSVASAMLTGELEYRKGNHEVAFAALREAIRREDALPYSDPPPWMQPVRHALGGLLLEQDRVAEAEVLFREDLGFAKDYPRRRAKLNNVWGLHGLYECFTRQGKTDEAVFIQSARDIAVATADVLVRASCYCRVSAVGEKQCCM